MATLHRSQLSKLCSTSETLDKAQSILRLANAKTGPGSGFVVKSTVAIPAVCAYLASEQLNAGEVSLQSAMAAACVSRIEFGDILKKVRAALRSDCESTVTNITYESLVDAYRIHPREDAMHCMEDVEAALPRVDILKEKYGTSILLCAIFYWVCQLMEEPSVEERSFRQSYSIPPKTLKAIVTMLDKQCDGISDQIKSYLLRKQSSAEASMSSQLNHTSKPICASPPKSPVKSALRPRILVRKTSTPVTTPSKKRTVAFSHLPSEDDGNHDDSTSYPETPTKKRRIDPPSPSKSRTSGSPTKQPSAASVAAFHAALKGSPIKQLVGQESDLSGPSTPRRPRHAKVAECAGTPAQVEPQLSPSRSQGQTTPTRPAVRRRFRPIFLEQQQWCARDPKVERMWAAADSLRDELVARHGQPFQRLRKHGGAVVGAA